MAIYYVKNGGNDDLDGLSDDNAWETIAKVNASAFNAGDSILFKKGSAWLEQLTAPSSGSEGSPIAFGAYGTGDKPVISGDVDLSETHNVGDNDYGIDTNGKQYLTFTGLKCSLQNKAGIRIRNSQVIIFDDVDVYDSYEQGTCDDGTGGAPFQNANITIKNGEFSYCGGSGINFSSADLIETIYIQNNLVHHNCQLDVVAAHDSAAGIKLYGAGGATVYIENNFVYNNGIAEHTGDSGVGIWLDTLSTGEATVRYNEIYDNGGTGVFVEACSSQNVYYNIVYNNGALLQAAGSPRGWYSGIGMYGANDNLIYNNTCYGNYWGISSENGVLNGTGNIVKNNIVDNSTAFEFFYAHASGDPNIDITATYNSYGAAKSGLAQINFSTKDTYAELEIALGYETNSTEADPLFTNPEAEDFTIQITSPCRDAGVNVGLSQDYFGRFVPMGLAPDIGMDELSVLMAILTPTHGETGQSITETINKGLVLKSANHEQIDQNPVLPMQAMAIVKNAIQQQTSQIGNISTNLYLTPKTLVHGHTGQAIILSVDFGLNTLSSVHQETNQILHLHGVMYLHPKDGDHQQIGKLSNLNAQFYLGTKSAIHDYISGLPDAIRTRYLDIENAIHGSIADKPSVVKNVILAIKDAIQAHVSGSLVLFVPVEGGSRIFIATPNFYAFVTQRVAYYAEMKEMERIWKSN